MSEREPDEQSNREDEENGEDVVEEIENDPSTAGSPDEPGDELRGG